MIDYSITWAYIVSRMESLYGITPNNEDEVAFWEIEKCLQNIWNEFFEIKYKEEQKSKNEQCRMD